MKNRQKVPKIRQTARSESDSSYTNTSLVRVINILLCLSNGFNTSTDIANYCRYSISTVHRLLNVMKKLNLTIQDPYTHKYYLGPLLAQLASNQTTAHRYLIINALQEMGRLSEYTQETINLTLLVQFRHVLLHDIPCRQDVGITEIPPLSGVLFALGATEKALLSQLVDNEIQEVMQKVTFPKITEKSVADKQLLLIQLNEIRQKGFTVSCGEKIPGAMCISAPIVGYEYPAALSIVGPEIRIKLRETEIINELKLSATSISHNINRMFQK
jgi:DNA-binding IclR family transcriptional regulator